ncbi:hypothetical protein [Hydrogenophaga sp. 5NK40-0174]|uniref:hypothetical protein n=1 Tax=Hydrogenophaga sp. 5NK40-0174 TaxID=3127649 RepID=UPI0031090672
MSTTELHYTADVVRRGTREFWWRQVGVVWPVVTIAVGAAAASLAWQHGRTDWLVGVMGSASLISLLVMAASYWVPLRRSLRVLGAMSGSPAQMAFTAEHLSISSPAGDALVPWTRVQSVWRLRSVWVLAYRDGGHSLLPLTDLASETQEQLLNVCRDAGVSVH